MNNQDEIAWNLMAFLHQSLILERACWMYFNLRAEEKDTVSVFGTLPGDEDPEAEYEKRKFNLVRHSTEINTYQRAFAYVAAAEGVDPDLLLKNLPGNSGAQWYPGHPRIISLIRECSNSLVGGTVNHVLLDEMVNYYKMQLNIFRSKFVEVLEDEPEELW